MEFSAWGGFQWRAQSVFYVYELWGREEGGERVAHEPAPGAEVVIGRKGRRSILEEDLLVGIRKVRR
jgi:hypothetical protein